MNKILFFIVQYVYWFIVFPWFSFFEKKKKRNNTFSHKLFYYKNVNYQWRSQENIFFLLVKSGMDTYEILTLNEIFLLSVKSNILKRKTIDIWRHIRTGYKQLCYTTDYVTRRTCEPCDTYPYDSCNIVSQVYKIFLLCEIERKKIE